MIEFEKYKLIHNFRYPNEPLKPWINEDNYDNLFKEDWNDLMKVICVINDTGFTGEILADIHSELANVNIEKCYYAVVEYIDWYEKLI